MKSFILGIPKGITTVLMLLIVFYFTFANNPLGVDSLKIFPFAEQVGHFILYFIVALAFILDYAKARLPHHSKINVEIALAAVAGVLSILMEISLMIKTHGYNYDYKNFIAGCLGATAAFLFYHYWLLHPFRHYLYHSIQHHWRYQHRRKKRK
jgi:hypothetical protein